MSSIFNSKNSRRDILLSGKNKRITVFFSLLTLVLISSFSVIFIMDRGGGSSSTNKKSWMQQDQSYSDESLVINNENCNKEKTECNINFVDWKNESIKLDKEFGLDASKKMFLNEISLFTDMGIYGPEISTLRSIKFTDSSSEMGKEVNGSYTPKTNVILINIKNIYENVKSNFEMISDNSWSFISEEEKLFYLKNSILKTLKHEYLHHLAFSYLHQPTDNGKILSSSLQEGLKNSNLDFDEYYNSEKIDEFFQINTNFKNCENSITHESYRKTVEKATRIKENPDTTESLEFFDRKGLISLDEPNASKRLDIRQRELMEKYNYNYFPYPYAFNKYMLLDSRNIPEYRLTNKGIKSLDYLLSLQEQFVRTYLELLAVPSYSLLNNSSMSSTTLKMRGSMCAGWSSVNDRKEVYESLLKTISYGEGISNIWYEKTNNKNFRLQGYVENEFLLDKNGKIKDHNELTLENARTGVKIKKVIFIPWLPKKNKITFNKNIYNWRTSYFIDDRRIDGKFGPSKSRIMSYKIDGRVDRIHKIDQKVAFYSDILKVSKDDIPAGDYIVKINNHVISNPKNVYSNFDFDGTNTTEITDSKGKYFETSDITLFEIADHISIVNKEDGSRTFNIKYLKDNFPYWDKKTNTLIVN